MDLLGVTKWLVKDTGRYDLVTDTTTWADNPTGTSPGAYHYINTAQRILDRMQDTPHASRWFFKVPAAGDRTVEMQYVRSIEEVWYSNATVGRVEVERVDLADLRGNYYEPTADVENGYPAYYAVNVEGVSPENTTLTAFTDTEDVITGEPSLYRGITFMPPSDGSYTMRIRAKMYCKPLSSSTDTSYWTIQCPEALVLVAKWLLEGLLRNADGMAALERAIRPILTDMDKDMADEDSVNVSQMEG